MKAKDILHEFRLAVSEVKESNRKTVRVSALESFLDGLEKYIDEQGELDRLEFESKLASFRAENEQNIAWYEAKQSVTREMFRSVVLFGQSALKSIILINGGAAVSMLAFIGNLASKQGLSSQAMTLFTQPMLLFAMGVLSGALGTGGTYVTQLFYAQEKIKLGIVFHCLTIFIVIIAYVFFAVGAFAAAAAVT